MYCIILKLPADRVIEQLVENSGSIILEALLFRARALACMMRYAP